MDADDASPAEMRRPPADYDADPLALDEDTVEELLTGALPPPQAPAGYVKVAQLLAAAAAAPTPEELAGPGAVLAELRAMARARSTATFVPARARPPRRRRRGLAVAIVVGALATGGVAGAATGHLPGPVRDAARTITRAEIGTPASPATGQPSTSATGTPNASGAGAAASRPGGAPGSTGAGVAADPATDPGVKGLCLAYAAGEGADRGGKLDATKFAELVGAAGGEEQVPAYCEELLPGDQQLKEPKKTKESEQPDAPGPGQQDPPAGTGSPGGPTASTGSGGQSQGASPSESGRP